MRKLLIIVVILYGCDGKKVTPTIVNKKYTNFWGNQLPKCICEFAYKDYENGDYKYFEDINKMHL